GPSRLKDEVQETIVINGNAYKRHSKNGDFTIDKVKKPEKYNHKVVTSKKKYHKK
ncbi:12735_t:CDS:1, partial [Gigaspora rosea]